MIIALASDNRETGGVYGVSAGLFNGAAGAGGAGLVVGLPGLAGVPAGGRADGRGVGAEVGDVARVDLGPALAPGPRRRAVELADQAVQALVPARAVARGLA